ncbi:MAG: TfoX/Sxy family protein [Anaerolineae bacterium]
MAWPKPSPELTALLDAAVQPFPAERKTMFGCPAYFVNGNMFTGVFANDLFVRLPDKERGEAIASFGEQAVFEPVAGRPMREYVVLPPAVVGDSSALRAWLSLSHAFASSIAAKSPKPRRRVRP